MNSDLPVRVLDFQPLRDGVPAHLLDWDPCVDVEMGDSEIDVTDTLINAADRDPPPEQQPIFCPPVRGTGGPLGPRRDGLREVIDLGVRGTRQFDADGLPPSIGSRATTQSPRMHANPAVSVSLVEPLLDPASDCLLWVGDHAQPSQGSVSSSARSLPLKPEDWDCEEAPAALMATARGAWRDDGGSPSAPLMPMPSSPWLPASGTARAHWRAWMPPACPARRSSTLLRQRDIGSVPEDTDLNLEISEDSTERLWSFIVRVLTPGTSGR